MFCPGDSIGTQKFKQMFPEVFFPTEVFPCVVEISLKDHNLWEMKSNGVEFTNYTHIKRYAVKPDTFLHWQYNKYVIIFLIVNKPICIISLNKLDDVF